jgi:SsrA-binding protein
MTLVPLSVYFNGRGRAKVELALAKGKNDADKRNTIKDREWKRDQARIMREYSERASALSQLGT